MSNFDLIKERNLSISEVHSKYVTGERSDAFEDIKKLKPVFSFDYVSMKEGDFCFNGKLLGRRELVKLIESFKDVSKYSYETMSKEYRFHFHDIDWNDVTISESDFYKCIYGNLNEERVITAYQFKAYGEARIIGFIYKGVFYLVMFDRGHNAYSGGKR
jgi:hypothetical protein